MQRRTFLKYSAILGGTLTFIPQFSFADGFKLKDSRTFHLHNRYDLSSHNKKEIMRLWVPLPSDKPYQKISDLKYEGDYDDIKITDAYGGKILYADWKKGSNTRTLNIDLKINTIDHNVSLKNAKATQNYSKEVSQFLEGTAHTPVNKTIQEFVAPIIKDAKTPLEKARAIYLWTCRNMYRDPDVIGCGVGDAKRAIEEKIFGGKCTDISSVFTALMRNAGIPCREIFGLRVGQSAISNALGKSDEKGFSDATGAQHCRAEFWIDGIGWVPADPADVTKVRLQENLEHDSERIKKIEEFQFGNWEMNWIGFNHARDFILSPKPTQFPLNMLGYPYAEIGDEPIDYYDAKEFKYIYNSQELNI